MRIIIKAKAEAKKESVERVGQPSLGLGLEKTVGTEMVVYKVSVKEPAVDGRANEAIRRALANYFDIAPSRIRLVSGQTSKQKIFEVT